MTDIAELLSNMNERDVRISLDGDGLRVIAPAGTMTEDRVAFMRQHREAIIDFLRAKEADRVHCFVLLGEAYPDEPDNNDPTEGKRIIAAVESAGGWLRLWEGKIVFRWRGEIPNAGELIDQIRAARTAVIKVVAD